MIHQQGRAGQHVPSVPSLIALKLHAMRSNPERLEKAGRDTAELLPENPLVLDNAALETLFFKHG